MQRLKLPMYRGYPVIRGQKTVSFPPHPPTRAPRRFKTRFSLLRQAWTVLRLCSACWFLAFFLPSLPILLQGTYFGSSTSDTRNGLLSISCGSWLTVYVGLCPHLFVHRPRFLTRPPSLSLAVYFLSSRTRAFNHERNIVAIPHCLLSSALGGSREPRRDVSCTGEISKDW